MSFLVDINPDMKLPKYNMVLCKLNEEKVMTIKNVEELKYDGNFATIHEMSFRVPLYRTSSSGEQIENERYHAIEGDMLILLNNMKYFYIHFAKEVIGADGFAYKEIQAYSREYELSQKQIIGYSGVGRFLYIDPVLGTETPTDDNGLELGFFNYIERVSGWRVGNINPDLLQVERGLEFNNTNILQAFQEVQRAFGCVFTFDTFAKTIDIEIIENMGSDQGLHISDKNFLQTLEKSIKSDEVKTRLYLYGKDNISIQRLNITGKPYIENYEFYKNRKYMSQGLIDALDNYDDYVLNRRPDFTNLVEDLDAYTTAIAPELVTLATLESELVVIQTELDVVISTKYATQAEQDIALSEVNLRQSDKQGEIDAQNAVIKAIENQYDDVISIVNAMREDTTIKQRTNPDDTSHPARFTAEHIRELDSFIREETFTDAVYEEHSLEELWADGHKILARISQPAIQFSLGVIDFLNIVEAQHVWSRFVLGDTVRLYQEELNFDYKVRMVGYSHTPDSNQLTLKFSTTDSMDDASLYLRDILDSMKNTSSAVNFSRFKWDKGDMAQTAISQYIDSNLDLAKQKLVAADGEDSQRVLIDSRGYWGQKLNPDGITYSPKQLRMLNDVIAMTKNNWNTVDIAISPDIGINAGLISGKIGNFATINSHQINVGGFEDNDGLKDALDRLLAQHQERVDLAEGQIIRIVIKLNALQNLITNLFIAGTITPANHTALNTLLDELEEEKIALNINYYGLLSEANLTGAQRDAYVLAKEEYDTSYNDLIDLITSVISDNIISAEEKSDLDDAFELNRTKLTEFKEMFGIVSQFVAEMSAAQISHYLIVNFDMEALLPDPDTATPQTDGRIDYWFYRAVPTLSNLPASNWTVGQTRQEHIDDLYYHMDTRVTYRFTVSGGTYSWEVVSDPDTMEAMEKASITKAAFDRKFSIFLTQPTTPYQIGDLWKKGNSASDIEVCIEPLISGNFDASHWMNAINLETVLRKFQNDIDDFSSDLILTRAEANGLRTSLNIILAESLELLGTAGSLLIPSEPERTMDLENIRDEYQAALILLEDYLNTHWLGETYPLAVTIEQRDQVKSLLDDVETKKTDLITEISLQLTLQNAVVVDEVYNGISINKVDGLKVFTTDGMMQSFFNATGGILMQKNIATKTSPVWEDVFVLDTQGNLSVTGNINMTSGNINWAEVPAGYDNTQALAAWVESGYATYIDAGGVYTGTLHANQIVAGFVNKDRIDVAGLDFLENATFASYAADTEGNTTVIQQNEHMIQLHAGRVTDLETNYGSLTIEADRIASEVVSMRENYDGELEHYGTLIDQTAEAILLQAEAHTELSDKVANIELTADAISLRVTEAMEYTDTEIISLNDTWLGRQADYDITVDSRISNVTTTLEGVMTDAVESLGLQITNMGIELTGDITTMVETKLEKYSTMDMTNDAIILAVSSIEDTLTTTYATVEALGTVDLKFDAIPGLISVGLEDLEVSLQGEITSVREDYQQAFSSIDQRADAIVQSVTELSESVETEYITLTGAIGDVQVNLDDAIVGLREEVSENYSTITQTGSAITSAVNSYSEVVEQTYSTKANVTAEVNDGIATATANLQSQLATYQQTISETYSTMTQTSSAITSAVVANNTIIARDYSTKGELESVSTIATNAASEVTQFAGLISSKVSETDFNGVVIASKINQTAEAFSIDAAKINLNGITRVNRLLQMGSSGTELGEIAFHNDASIYAGNIGTAGVGLILNASDTWLNGRLWVGGEEVTPGGSTIMRFA